MQRACQVAVRPDEAHARRGAVDAVDGDPQGLCERLDAEQRETGIFV